MHTGHGQMAPPGPAADFSKRFWQIGPLGPPVCPGPVPYGQLSEACSLSPTDTWYGRAPCLLWSPVCKGQVRVQPSTVQELRRLGLRGGQDAEPAERG